MIINLITVYMYVTEEICRLLFLTAESIRNSSTWIQYRGNSCLIRCKGKWCSLFLQTTNHEVSMLITTPASEESDYKSWIFIQALLRLYSTVNLKKKTDVY